ncbi:uncharacterized protein LOC133521501 [Cydia pomonella]|uniref:uncharacterized protein LOC133521501 n=1 Tax=Cydia pomonella TaxID=82600 RepID=UPI002ADE48EE|nr:uncharacterized protein LOC133521501 [Cydia pomonella]
MKLTVALALIISSAFAAPTDDLILKERTKKSPSGSPYGAGGSYGTSYGPPCAGAAPLALYLAPQGAPHYREEEMTDEHSERARSYEGPSYGASASAISLAPAAPSGAVGYFPHGKIGPCGVPLLLSCAPNVVAGHLATHHGYAAPAYKQAENEETTELKEAMEKSWSEAQRDANLGPHHHHLDSLISTRVLTGDHTALGEHAHDHMSKI